MVTAAEDAKWGPVVRRGGRQGAGWIVHTHPRGHYVWSGVKHGVAIHPWKQNYATIDAAAKAAAAGIKKFKAPTRNPPFKLLKRAPLPLSALEHTTELGHLLDMYVDTGDVRKFRPKGRPLLQWSKSAKALIIWTGVRTPKKRRGLELDAAQARMYELWTDDTHRADSLRTLRTPAITGDWERVGRIISLGYHSDKFGEPENFDHTFTSSVRLYRFGAAGPALWVIRGGTLRVTRRGIEG